METIKVSNRNESDNDLKNIFVSRKDIINSYGNKFLKLVITVKIYQKKCCMNTMILYRKK